MVKKKLAKLLLVVFLVYIFPLNVFSEVVWDDLLGGNYPKTIAPAVISQNTIWKAENGPYYIGNEMIVENNCSLDIQSGSKIFLGVNATIRVRGIINVEAAQMGDVVFTSAVEGTFNENSKDSYWNGIIIESTGNFNAVGIEMKYANKMLTINRGGQVSIAYSELKYIGDYAVKIEDGGRLMATNCEIKYDGDPPKPSATSTPVRTTPIPTVTTSQTTTPTVTPSQPTSTPTPTITPSQPTNTPTPTHATCTPKPTCTYYPTRSPRPTCTKPTSTISPTCTPTITNMVHPSCTIKPTCTVKPPCYTKPAYTSKPTCVPNPTVDIKPTYGCYQTLDNGIFGPSFTIKPNTTKLNLFNNNYNSRCIPSTIFDRSYQNKTDKYKCDKKESEIYLDYDSNCNKHVEQDKVINCDDEIFDYNGNFNQIDYDEKVNENRKNNNIYMNPINDYTINDCKENERETPIINCNYPIPINDHSISNCNESESKKPLDSSKENINNDCGNKTNSIDVEKEQLNSGQSKYVKKRRGAEVSLIDLLQNSLNTRFNSTNSKSNNTNSTNNVILRSSALESTNIYQTEMTVEQVEAINHFLIDCAGSAIISNSKLSDFSGVGVKVQNSGTVFVSTTSISRCQVAIVNNGYLNCYDDTISNNNWGVYSNSDFDCSLTDGIINTNYNYGIYNKSPNVFEATNNNWGGVPKHIDPVTNQWIGDADKIFGNVTY